MFITHPRQECRFGRRRELRRGGRGRWRGQLRAEGREGRGDGGVERLRREELRVRLRTMRGSLRTRTAGMHVLAFGGNAENADRASEAIRRLAACTGSYIV